MQTHALRKSVLAGIVLAVAALAAHAQSTLIPTGAAWKYLDTGVDQGAGWTNLAFNDAGWASGNAPLGYGTSYTIATTVSYGGNASAKYPTTYFRKTVVVEDPCLYGSIELNLIYDDGAVVYLNGAEVWRINLPAAPTVISYSTLANGASTYSWTQRTVPTSVLVPGTNIVAIEIHQGSATSSDIVMDFGMTGNVAPSVVLTAPASNQVFNVPASIPVTATAADVDGFVALVEFFANGDKIGEDSTAPYGIVWTNATAGNYLLTAVATDNTAGQGATEPVPITVTDPAPPRVLDVSGSTNRLTVMFSKQVTAASATDAANYVIDGGSVAVLGAVLLASESTVQLDTAYIAPAVTHTLAVSGVGDSLGQTMAPTNLTFTVVDYTQYSVGSPSPEGTFSTANGTIILNASGTNAAGARDQFTLLAVPTSNDFDIQIRIAGLGTTDPWAQGGLMARESAATGSRYAAVFATPSILGCYFASRSTLNGATTQVGSFPANHPNTWLRLKRAGDMFTGYVSPDGHLWAQLGTVTLSGAVRPMLVGLAGASGVAGQTVTVRFAESKDVTGGVIGTVTLPVEPPGPCSRGTGMIISEIMYHPRTDPNTQLEFIELLNAQPILQDIGGWRMAGSVDYTFPAGTVIPGGGIVVVARNPADMMAAYPGLNQVYGPWDGAVTNNLPDDAGTVRLRNQTGALLLEVNYEGAPPWPIAADGCGHSLVLARPSYGERDVRAWAASDHIGGSPGTVDGCGLDPIRSVVINEFLAHTDDPNLDFVELYNHGNQRADLSGASLSDDRDEYKFRIPDNTVLEPGGCVAFDQNQLGFALSSGGERLYLVNSNRTRVIDAVAFEAQANGVSTGRHPDGAPTFHELTALSPGAPNAGLLIRDVVINEIMFHPPTGDDDDQFVELYNRGANAVNLGGWSFTDGIDFAFPPDTVLAPESYLVVARDQGRLLANYGHLNASNTVGNFSGRLAHGGERLALSMPEYSTTTNAHGGVTTNVLWVVADEVTYVDAGRWAQWADGGGSSLELIDPNSDNRLAANWADSDETAKSQWSFITHRGVLDHVYMRDTEGNRMNEIQVMILGRGEALMDDVVVKGTNDVNLVLNPDFTGGLTYWLIQGNHVRSTLEPPSFTNPSECLHLRATAGGDNGANRVECDLSSELPPNITASISGRFRWLRGFPIVLMRLHGGGLEAVGSLPIPANLGTPGQPNSRLLPNAGPAVYDVSHSPVLPAAGEAVVVTARVNDPDGVAAVHLEYRLDPAATLATIPMVDDGTGGDAVGADGLYSATLPGRAAGTLVAFRITATDAQMPPGTTLFPPDAPTRECLIRFGDTAVSGCLGVYRLWQTGNNYTNWTNRERMSNEPLDITFVYGNFRAVYNAGARYRGSPFTRNPSSPTATGANFVWTLPEDDLFLGSDELNIDSLEPTGRDATALREVTAFTMAEQMGLPFSYQRYVRLVINGTASASYVNSDSQQPNNEYIAMWFPDGAEGDLYKVDDWFEFADTLTGSAGTGRQGNKSASLDAFYTVLPGETQGTLKKARYRWMWEKKFNNGLNDDYGSLFAAVNALTEHNTNLYVGQVESAIEAEQWMTAFALRHVLGDWDGYGYNRGKNQFTYKPHGKKFHMLLWDLDFSIGCNNGHGPTQDLFTLNLGGLTAENHMPEIKWMYDHPHFRRMYLQALQRIADGPLQDAAYSSLLDSRYRCLLASGVTGLTSPYVASGAQSLSLPAWIQQRRTYVQGRIANAANVTFALTGPATVTTTTNLLTLTGNAPLGVHSITVNDIVYPVKWTTTNAWSIRVPLPAGTTALRIQARDCNGNPFPATQPTVTATFNGTPDDPAASVLFSELMFDPAVPGAEYVELHNRSTTTTFDLSGWWINGLDYTFPTGTLILPQTCLVLARDTLACLYAYGTNTPIVGQYNGSLQGNGETLTLLKPGPTPDNPVVIDKVRYESVPPWSTNASNTGSSLQLVDLHQDNCRPLNWHAEFTPAVLTEAVYVPAITNEGWVFYAWTGQPKATGGTLTFWIDSVGEFWLDQVAFVEGDVPETGPNLLANPGFESGALSPWVVLQNASNTTVTAQAAHDGSFGANVRVDGAAGAQARFQQSVTGLSSTGIYTLSFWYHTTLSPNVLNYRLTSSFRTGLSNSPAIILQRNVMPPQYNPPVLITPAVLSHTPGAANQGAATLAPIPPLWINEVQPHNTAGPRDAANEPEPWIELYNAGTNTVPLAGCYLSDNYSTLDLWAFPPGAALDPGEFKVVFADGESGETTASEWHTSFRLQPGGGAVVLSRQSTQLEVLDYINYGAVPTNASYGAFPDGQPFTKLEFYHPTPAAANDASSAPVQLFINEWMAANGGFILDPADADADDWFELHNPGDAAVNLSGYYLTDDPARNNKFRIPDGAAIPARGYLLFWADEETDQNRPDREVHVNFRLSAGGERIRLCSPRLDVLDSVDFGPQTNNVSQGRSPDGSANIVFFFTT
ncbi:MAG: lamin tail domain-containing protein, partial [Verrucomicrobia bacterium]|nr:lamin tail domain-containing protein [Verrucomicrobiota bacterium]